MKFYKGLNTLNTYLYFLTETLWLICHYVSSVINAAINSVSILLCRSPVFFYLSTSITSMRLRKYFQLRKFVTIKLIQLFMIKLTVASVSTTNSLTAIVCALSRPTGSMATLPRSSTFFPETRNCCARQCSTECSMPKSTTPIWYLKKKHQFKFFSVSEKNVLLIHKFIPNFRYLKISNLLRNM